MRLGLLGGSFDPPHIGHLLAATDVVEALGLDRLVFVPAGEQPLKAGAMHAPPADRLAMVRAMAGDDPRFAVDAIEIDRQGLSYSVDTLETYAERHPTAERYFLVGADVLSTLPKWRAPERVVRLARLVVMQRDGELPPGEMTVAGAAATVLATRRIEVSSTEIRARVRAGRPIRGFVPDAVAAHIAAAGLYR